MNKKPNRNEISSKRYDSKQLETKRGIEKIKPSKMITEDNEKRLRMPDRGDAIVKIRNQNTPTDKKPDNLKARKNVPLAKTKDNDVEKVVDKDLGKHTLDHGDSNIISQVKIKNDDKQVKSRINNESMQPASKQKDVQEDKIEKAVSTLSGDSIDISSFIPKIKIERKCAGVALDRKTWEPVKKARILAEKDHKKVEGNVDVTKLDTRKRIRDRYTVKLKKTSTEERATETASDTTQPKKSVQVPPFKEKLEQLPIYPDIEKNRDHEARRKPIIKTVSSKNGPTYKVASVDQKSQKCVHISMPHENRQEVIEKKKDNLEISRAGIREKFTKRTKDRQYLRKKQRKVFKTKYRTDFSPEGRFSTDSLITEVAKWAPSCINRHTKPYYEAWVNTTLAAISKGSKKDKTFLERKSIIQSFQKALEEVPSWTELVNFDYSDERYTGKIKVIHR